MKKNIFISAIFFISLFIISCNSDGKKSGGALGSNDAVADSIEYYVDKYVKEVDSMDALATVAKVKGNTDLLENEFTERKEAIATTSRKIDEFSKNLTDEMKSRKEVADKTKNTAEQTISGVLQGK